MRKKESARGKEIVNAVSVIEIAIVIEIEIETETGSAEEAQSGEHRAPNR